MSKRLFDTIRAMLGRGLTQREVDALNASMKPDAPSEPERNMTPGKIGADGIALIKQFEGCHRKRPDGWIEAYPDPGSGAEPWTIGYGATRDGLHGFVKRDTIWTQQQCDERLEADVNRFAEGVSKALGRAAQATSQRQFDSFVSFAFNVGLGAFERSTLLAKHRAGDHNGAAAEFARWNRAGGRVLAGLTRRRTAEAKLYREGSK